MSDLKLGRSIDELMEENKIEYLEHEEIVDVEISKIRPNPDQPRSVFDISSIKELADSINEHGLLQPVILKPVNNGYIIVAGERRLRASKVAGLKKIPSVIRNYSSKSLAEIALIENLQREDLSPIEEALALTKMTELLHITHEELGNKIGKSRAYVTNTIGLLNLPTSIIEDVNAGLLSMGHARSLSKIRDVDYCLELRDRIIKENLTVRALENIISGKRIQTNNKINSDVIKNFRTQLKDIFNNDIKYKVSKNSISIKYNNEEELNKVLQFLKRG